jgi:NDP-sugar pyrophosphorylase family protein
VDHSIILNGGRIREIGRLEDSIIGRRVVVQPGETRQGALNLLVGDDCHVELGRLR